VTLNCSHTQTQDTVLQRQVLDQFCLLASLCSERRSIYGGIRSSGASSMPPYIDLHPEHSVGEKLKTATTACADSWAANDKLSR